MFRLEVAASSSSWHFIAYSCSTSPGLLLDGILVHLEVTLAIDVGLSIHDDLVDLDLEWRSCLADGLPYSADFDTTVRNLFVKWLSAAESVYNAIPQFSRDFDLERGEEFVEQYERARAASTYFADQS